MLLGAIPSTVSMQSPKRELARIELPRVLIYTTALTCGVLAALALQIHLSRAGLDLVGLWDSLLSTKTLQLRTAGPWWAIGGTAFIASGATAAALSRLPLPWRRFRLLRWAAGAGALYPMPFPLPAICCGKRGGETILSMRRLKPHSGLLQAHAL